MNPQANAAPGLGLPQPSFEIGQAPVGHAPEAFHPPGNAPYFAAIPQVDSVPSSPQPLAPSTAQMQPQPQPAIVPSAPISATDVQGAANSDDEASGIDEEWVNKAREVVERTHTDPYVQSRELGRVKAQYIKAKYNKNIKTIED
jgi:hypothetical protein